MAAAPWTVPERGCGCVSFGKTQKWWTWSPRRHQASGFRVQGIAIAIPGRRCSRVADRGSGLWIKEAVSAVHVLTYGGGMYCRLMDMDNVEGGRRRGICKGLHPCAPSANAHSPAPRSWWFV
jgi:hypothetical protein